jgi:hypothetical protein
MFSWCGWPIIKSILEALYFIAGIIIAGAAIKGLDSLKMSREIAKTNAKREALKFATERCQYFADKVVLAHEVLSKAYQQAKCTFIAMSPLCSVKNGEIITNAGFNSAVYNAESLRLVGEIPRYLNTLEAFAIPFVALVADDDLGYQETGIPFCTLVKEALVMLFHTRGTIYSAPYQSTIQLYERWDARRIAEERIQKLKKAEQDAKQTPKPGKVDALGTEDED